MKKRWIVALAAVAVATAGSAFAGDAAKGKAVFDKLKCAMCHTETKNPLAKTGAENSEADLKAWVRTPKEMLTKKNKKGTMPAYGPEKISDADLEDLVAYMATLK
jgi:mono/diheme cytochrome c family protein